MGRGLSELQKAILRLAYYNHVREDIPNPLYTVRASCPLPDSPKPLLGLQMGELVALVSGAKLARKHAGEQHDEHESRAPMPEFPHFAPETSTK